MKSKLLDHPAAGPSPGPLLPPLPQPRVPWPQCSHQGSCLRASPRGPPAAWLTPRSLLARPPPPQVGFHLHGRCLRLPSMLQDVCPPLTAPTPRSGPGTWVSRGLRTIRTDCRVPPSGRQQARVYGGVGTIAAPAVPATKPSLPSTAPSQTLLPGLPSTAAAHPRASAQDLHHT